MIGPAESPVQPFGGTYTMGGRDRNLEHQLPEWNLIAVWIGFGAGVLTGAAIGLWFHREDWLGGYGSWRRRLIRLGHIACFGLAFVNLAFVVTARYLDIADESRLLVPSVLLIVGAVTMPMVCFLSAWKKHARHLFFIPVVSLLVGCVWTAWLVLETA